MNFLLLLLLFLFLCAQQYISKSSLHIDENNRCQKLLQSTSISSVTCAQHQEFPGGLSVMSKTFWCRQNGALEKRGEVLMKEVWETVSKKGYLIKSIYKNKSTAWPIAKRLLRIMFFEPAPRRFACEGEFLYTRREDKRRFCRPSSM